jgi:hypothetical protein
MTMMMAIPFARTQASQNPNLRLHAGSDPAEPYFRAMTVAFGSLRRWHPLADLVLISNAPPPDEHMVALRRLGVRYCDVPFDHRPPPGFTERFEASLYALDALASLTSETTVMLDPDVLCMTNLTSLLERVQGQVGALRMNFPETENINGLTRLQAGELHGLLGEPERSPAHYGGEVYVLPLSRRDALVSRTERAWSLALARHEKGLTKFTTEEHILSYAMRDAPVALLNGDVRRIWTTHRYRTVDGREAALSIWHLPAEKTRGFATLYPSVTDAQSWFWRADPQEFVDRCGRAMGLHGRGPARLARDVAGAVVNALAG